MLLEEYSWLHGPGTLSRNRSVGSFAGRVEDIAYGIIAPIIVSVGVLGNLVAIFILRLPQFRGVTYTYFLVLAVSDLFSLLLCVSMLHRVSSGGGTLHLSTAAWYSYLEPLFINIPMSMSVFIVICITVDRHCSVCRPAEFKNIHTRSFAWICMGSSLLASMMVWLPMSFLRQPELATECETSSFRPPDNQTWWVACFTRETWHDPFFITYTWIREIFVTFIPIVILITLNSLTLREFKRHSRRRQGMLVSGQDQRNYGSLGQSQDEKNLTTLLLAVMISFVITIVPSGISNSIITVVDTKELNFVIFKAIANCLQILNHALNFYLYILCSKPIREVLRNCYKKHRPLLPKIWNVEGPSFTYRAGTDICQQQPPPEDSKTVASESQQQDTGTRSTPEYSSQHTIAESGSTVVRRK